MTGWAFYGILSVLAAFLAAVNLENGEKGWALTMAGCALLFGSIAFMAALVGA